MFIIYNQIEYLINKAIMLSNPYEKQIVGLCVLRDYLTDDIANEWIDEDIYLLKELVKKGIVDESVLEIYIKINDNFASVSLGGEMYNQNIWTLTGLKSDPFWEKQRKLASNLLNQLTKTTHKTGDKTGDG